MSVKFDQTIPVPDCVIVVMDKAKLLAVTPKPLIWTSIANSQLHVAQKRGNRSFATQINLRRCQVTLTIGRKLFASFPKMFFPSSSDNPMSGGIDQEIVD